MSEHHATPSAPEYQLQGKINLSKSTSGFFCEIIEIPPFPRKTHLREHRQILKWFLELLEAEKDPTRPGFMRPRYRVFPKTQGKTLGVRVEIAIALARALDCLRMSGYAAKSPILARIASKDCFTGGELHTVYPASWRIDVDYLKGCIDRGEFTEKTYKRKLLDWLCQTFERVRFYPLTGKREVDGGQTRNAFKSSVTNIFKSHEELSKTDGADPMVPQPGWQERTCKVWNKVNDREKAIYVFQLSLKVEAPNRNLASHAKL